MLKNRRHIPNALLVLLLFASVLYAQQVGWFERVFPRKTPQVVAGTAVKPPVEPPAGVLALQDAFAKVAEDVKPAVVNIAAVQIAQVQQNPHQFYYGDPEEFFHRFFGESRPQRRTRPQEFRREGTGSGVIIDPEGFILTNNHVVQGADQLTVTLSNDKTYRGKVVGSDLRSDLAVIRIKGSGPFPFVQLGDSSQMRVGDWVLAFGSPFGLQQTVTSGIVSAIRQSLNIEGKAFRNLLQTDAAINRGNSGGPLVNLRGELVGINTAIYAPTGVFSGVGFAIPVNDAKIILKDLIEKGFVERSWMGVEIAEVDEVIASQFGLKNAEGALINQVKPGSPADKAGIVRGDVIIGFDGKKTPTIQILQDVVSTTPPERSVPVRIVRAGKEKTLTLKTEVMPRQEDEEVKKPSNQGDSSGVEWMGATFSNPDKTGTLSTPQGVVVSEIPVDSLAAEAGLRVGDLVQAVNQIPVKGLADLAMVKQKIDPKKGVVLDVVREGRSFYLSYKSLSND